MSRFFCALLLTAASLAPAYAQTVVKDILQATLSQIGLSLDIPNDGVILREVFYFVADDGSFGYELWRTDGTDAGTWRVKDIWEGVAGSAPTHLATFNGMLYFQASDGVHGRELWISDGSAEGTRMLTDINAGAGHSVPAEFTPLNGKLLFRAYDPVAGSELWATDGLQTDRLADLAPGDASSSPLYLTVFKGRLYFSANDIEHGAELWTSDGTAAGTKLFKDLVPGEESGWPHYLNVADGSLYLRTSESSTGTRLWISDGTEAGTSVAAVETPGQVTLSWSPPTTNIDGTPLADLAGYRIVFGISSAALDREIEVDDPLAISHAVQFLRPGTYFFAMHAVNTDHVASEPSALISTRVY